MDCMCKWIQHLIVRNERYTHCQVSVQTHSDLQKTRRSTKVKMERKTLLKIEEALNSLYPAAADDV